MMDGVRKGEMKSEWMREGWSEKGRDLHDCFFLFLVDREVKEILVILMLTLHTRVHH